MTKEAYYKGKYFDSIQEMLEYAHKWRSQTVDEESFDILINELRENFHLNLFSMHPECTNEELSIIFEGVFYDFIKRIDALMGKKEKSNA